MAGVSEAGVLQTNFVPTNRIDRTVLLRCFTTDATNNIIEQTRSVRGTNLQTSLIASFLTDYFLCFPFEIRMTSKGEEAAVYNEQNHTQQNETSSENDESYADNPSRITKDNLYMIIALWMEDLVEEAPEHHRKVGAVLVSPNDVIMAADCSRDEVHAVARLLAKHHDKAEGCKMFMSRKPCPLCAKLLVQSKVKRVLFLPFEPECHRWLDTSEKEMIFNKKQMRQVDTLFTASSIAQTKFVLQVEDNVIEAAKRYVERIRAKKAICRKSMEEHRANVETYRKELIKKYSAFKDDSEWMKRIQVDLPWPELDRKLIKKNREYFEKVMEWIAVVSVGLDQRELSLHDAKTNDHSSHTPFNQRIMEIARFLAQRSDDPETWVGTVIVSPENKILSFGWNGFPLKAHYGEFARASKSDEDASDKKYPYSIHAEQNALLMRNSLNLKDATLYVTKSPCDECAPLIAMEGIKTVFVDENVEPKKPPEWYELGEKLGYNWFVDKVDDGTFTCYKNQQKPSENVT